MKLILSVVLLLGAGQLFKSSATGNIPFGQEDVTISYCPGGSLEEGDTVTLRGTVTYPVGIEPRGAVVLATGSGLQNRDEEIAGHRPFKVLAEYLSQRGYAVLRMDDRGFGESGDRYVNSTTDDFVIDTKRELAEMSKLFPGIRRGVIGHSEGGTIAIRSAGECDFIVTLAAPAFAVDSILMAQIRNQYEYAGQLDEFERIAPVVRNRYRMIKSPVTTPMLRAWLIVDASRQIGVEIAQLPDVRKRIEVEIEGMVSAWYRAALRYNPDTDIRAVEIPWLALNGTLDCQVDVENLEEIGRLNKDATTIALPGHNHLFQRCISGMPDEYATIEEDISQDALHAIADWLDRLL